MNNKNLKYLVYLLIIIIVVMILIKVVSINSSQSENTISTNTNILENTSVSTYDKDKDFFDNYCQYRKTTFENIQRNFEKENMTTEERLMYKNYCPYGLDGVAGDSCLITLVESNYKQYEDKNAKIEQYDGYPITFKLAVAHEATQFSFHQSIEDILKKQIGVTTSTGEKIAKTDTFTLKGMLIINGNDESEDAWKKNARAKTLKVTIDNDKEYEYVLEDTVEAQLLDINYTNKSVANPIEVKIEVVDTYGDDNQTTYISDILFGMDQTFSGGR